MNSHTAVLNHRIWERLSAKHHREREEERGKTYRIKHLISPHCVSPSVPCVSFPPQEAALWTAHETSPPATLLTSPSPPPEGHCFISLCRLFTLRQSRWDRQKSSQRETKGGEEREEVSIRGQRRCGCVVVWGLTRPGEQGASTGWLMCDGAKPLHSQCLCVYSRCSCWCVCGRVAVSVCICSYECGFTFEVIVEGIYAD